MEYWKINSLKSVYFFVVFCLFVFVLFVCLFHVWEGVCAGGCVVLGFLFVCLFVFVLFCFIFLKYFLQMIFHLVFLSYRTVYSVKPFPQDVSVTVITGNYYDEQLPSSLNKVRDWSSIIVVIFRYQTLSVQYIFHWSFYWLLISAHWVGLPCPFQFVQVIKLYSKVPSCIKFLIIDVFLFSHPLDSPLPLLQSIWIQPPPCIQYI